MVITFAILTLAIMGATRLSFQHGLAGYLAQVEQEQAHNFTHTLAAYYRVNGSWEPLVQNPRLWGRMQRMANGAPPAYPSEDAVLQDLIRRPGRLALLDETGHRLIGPPLPFPDEGKRYPVQVHGTTVGILYVMPSTHITDGLAQQFERQQERILGLIGLIALLVAAIASYLLANRLLGPLQALTGGTRALTTGDYSARVQLRTRDEFQALADDFNQLAATLEQNEAARRRWIADISHELRTPLSVLRGEMEALEDGIRTLDMQALQSLQAEAALLGKLVDDLYQLALCDVGSLDCHRETVDMTALLREIVAQHQTRFTQQRLTITQALLPAPAFVQADPTRLKQLLNNLLENTLRYTDPGGRLHVETRQQDRQLIITLDDTAPGVPADALPLLFEHLFRVEPSRSRRHGGAGLGLALCRRIVEGHRGRITAAPSPLGGLRISVCLPLTKP
ncbi:ATP-binding protein [Ectothiorhodospira variabilis]|uniref:ATP-binding protein n=1 Tax=Ectothiorhodospira variabilis TaxID=505694 RepID=UPI001EFAC877|nr:ATP-binding protein [Ectothiorhodospira variabilis]MCG5493325.1 ATP-binding protein [Ectothiorhodospira variabilis]MCG5502654.1 ATP-binding protein [Ectothiorhodospira variabilis]MCG5505580.1 ATP-binding protein [Ectothiorhodospira variabilis]